MTEYEELRRMIIPLLEQPFKVDLRRKRGFTEARVKLADKILSIIADHCWLKDVKELPDDFYYEFTDIGSGWTGRIEEKISVHLKKFLEEFGYKSVKELKKEAK